MLALRLLEYLHEERQFHALVRHLSNDGYSEDDQHIAMYTHYLDLLATSLQKAFPNVLPGDAKGLLLQGLINLDGGTNPPENRWTTSFVDRVLQFSKFTRAQVAAIFTRYEVTHTSGTKC